MFPRHVNIYTMKATRATAHKFLKDHSVAILATVSEKGIPSSTPITYHLTDNHTLRFATGDSTTKIRDIKKNNSVSLSVLDPDDPVAVNIVGEASVIDDVDAVRETQRAIGKIFVAAHQTPHVFKHKRGDVVVVEIRPIRMQYTDFRETTNLNHESIIEL